MKFEEKIKIYNRFKEFHAPVWEKDVYQQYVHSRTGEEYYFCGDLDCDDCDDCALHDDDVCNDETITYNQKEVNRIKKEFPEDFI